MKRRVLTLLIILIIPMICVSQSVISDKDTVTNTVSEDTLSVYFYLDAAIIMQKSRKVIDKVYREMVNNNDIRILIHGHTNGNNMGPIITRGLSEEHFLLVEGLNKWRIGSAIALSRLRAESVRDYLVERGIDEERIEVVGWGGRFMLYEEHVEKSWYNARADIEFIKSDDEVQ